MNRLPLFLVALALFAGVGFGLLPPARAVSLPPRSTPTPPSHGDDDRDEPDDSPAGAYIELAATGAPARAWAGVEWQDSAGNWHKVEGWQGTLVLESPSGGLAVVTSRQRWWVAPKDFGHGPFRWVISQGPGGIVLGVSQPFSLPLQGDTTVYVDVTL